LAEQLSFKVAQVEGPLDLILQLISKHKLNIYDIEITKLLEQYMDYIQQVQSQQMEIASEFLEMASRLVYIKSVSLLPKHEELEEQLKQELTGQLIEGTGMSEDTGGDHRVSQQNRVGARFLPVNAQGTANRLGIPQDGGGRCQGSTGGKTAHRNLARIHPQFAGVAAKMQDRSGGVQQRLPAQGSGGHGVGQYKDLVTGLQKRHGHGIAFPYAAMVIPAARTDQDSGSGVETGHRLGTVTQIPGQCGTAGQDVGIHFHKRALLFDGVQSCGSGWVSMYSAMMSAASRTSSGQGRFL